MYNNVTGASILDTFIAYTGRTPRNDKWDAGLLREVEEAMRQLLNAAGEVYNYDNAGRHTHLARTYRNDIRRAMCEAGFEHEGD